MEELFDKARECFVQTNMKQTFMVTLRETVDHRLLM